MITVEQVRNNPQVRTYIQKADEALAALGYTEHSFAHVGKVAKEAREILLTLGYSPREAELAEIAGWLHDIGNVINRVDHAQSGAVMAFRILDKLGAEAEEISTIISAIGNHDESTAYPVNPIAAALILGIKPTSGARVCATATSRRLTFTTGSTMRFINRGRKLLPIIRRSFWT